DRDELTRTAAAHVRRAGEAAGDDPDHPVDAEPGAGDRCHVLRRRGLLWAQRRSQGGVRHRRGGCRHPAVARRAEGSGRMRVYLPATVSMLRELNEKRELAPVDGTAFGLTPTLREFYTGGTEEELEYVALLEAARASLRLVAAELDAGSSDPPRRAVVAADIDDVELRPDLDAAVVRLSGTVPMKAVAAVHVDAPEAEEAVRAAAEVIDEAALGDDDAEFALGEAEDHELAWYAPQELPFLLESL